jgi:CBS-domain-containing membrane protein
MKTINEYTVGELMSRSLVLIKETAPLSEAIAKMLSAKVSALIVEKSHEHDVFGIVTRKDIVVEAAEGGGREARFGHGGRQARGPFEQHRHLPSHRSRRDGSEEIGWKSWARRGCGQHDKARNA